MVTAFMPSCRTAESVARWPGPVILTERIGSFTSIAASTPRLPGASTSPILAKAPAGSESSDQGISRRSVALSSLPNRSGLPATTMVCVATVRFCDSRLFMRASAWLVSHDCATKTASRPNRTANPIMTKVLARTIAISPNDECLFLFSLSPI
jgi:hypothetical protein